MVNVKLPEQLQKITPAEEFVCVRHRWNTNEVSWDLIFLLNVSYLYFNAALFGFSYITMTFDVMSDLEVSFTYKLHVLLL